MAYHYLFTICTHYLLSRTYYLPLLPSWCNDHAPNKAGLVLPMITRDVAGGGEAAGVRSFATMIRLNEQGVFHLGRKKKKKNYVRIQNLKFKFRGNKQHVADWNKQDRGAGGYRYYGPHN